MKYRVSFYSDKEKPGVIKSIRLGAKSIGRKIKNKSLEYKDSPGNIWKDTKNLGKKIGKTIKDNPIDTTAYVLGDLVLPGILAKKAAAKWKGPKGKVAAGLLAGYAMSPIGLTSATIAAKNKWKKTRAAGKTKQEAAEEAAKIAGKHVALSAGMAVAPKTTATGVGLYGLYKEGQRSNKK